MCRLNCVGVEKWQEISRYRSMCKEKWVKKKLLDVKKQKENRDTNETHVQKEGYGCTQELLIGPKEILTCLQSTFGQSTYV